MKAAKILSQIEKAKQQHTLIEVYVKKENGEFEVGYPLISDHRWLILATLNNQGQFAGYTLFALKRIKRVHSKTTYLQILDHYQAYLKEQQQYDPFKLSAKSPLIAKWAKHPLPDLFALLTKQRAYITLAGRFDIAPVNQIVTATAHHFTCLPFDPLTYQHGEPVILAYKDISFLQFGDSAALLYQQISKKLNENS
ncbi:hypothetical protein [Loigolactobacillus binensis]|uniref:WYL domain-containing protein n=1 Tax=Loigolactobacillus binensis TaxID=2559922 RepID=A0ABW3EE74_9LACO|nr:hypothetical protein [Loigolactobacillus binensis]